MTNLTTTIECEWGDGAVQGAGGLEWGTERAHIVQQREWGARSPKPRDKCILTGSFITLCEGQALQAFAATNFSEDRG